MLTRWKQWREKRRQKARKAWFDAGYDYAAGALLRGEETVESLEAKLYWCDPDPLPINEFDHGMEAAIAKLSTLMNI